MSIIEKAKGWMAKTFQPARGYNEKAYVNDGEVESVFFLPLIQSGPREGQYRTIEDVTAFGVSQFRRIFGPRKQDAVKGYCKGDNMRRTRRAVRINTVKGGSK
jgi:hypothetical protein